jgi:putative SOS response-associated peptidase YedK
MCGRYSLFVMDELYDRFQVDGKLDLKPNYNVAPTQTMPVVVRESPNSFKLMKWGLIPSWSKEPKVSFSNINARAENLMESRVYKRPFYTSRCLVPANGYYEWKRLSEKEKQPYMIHFKHNETFAFAGIYDTWVGENGEQVQSYAIITCQPNKVSGEIHNRMPVILPRDAEDAWLDHEADPMDLMKYLQPAPDTGMEAYPVSKGIGSPKNNTPDVIKRVQQ